MISASKGLFEKDGIKADAKDGFTFTGTGLDLGHFEVIMEKNGEIRAKLRVGAEEGEPGEVVLRRSEVDAEAD